MRGWMLFVLLCIMMNTCRSARYDRKSFESLESIDSALWEQILYMTDDYIEEFDNEINGDAEETVMY